MALDPESHSPAVSNYIDVLQELHKTWAGPLTAEEARRVLADPLVSDEKKWRALRRAPAGSLKGLNLLPLFLPRVRVDDKEAIAALVGLKFSAQEIAVLDEGMYAALSLPGDRYWNVDVYLAGTRPTEWPPRQAFYDEGMRRGGKILHNLLIAVEFEAYVTRAFLERMLALRGLTEEEKSAVAGAIADLDEDE